MLTADLSVLGGYHVKPGFFPDSIFEQFHVHEAIRLTRLPADSDALQGGRNGRALCIGVGVGVVAQSLHQLGCKLDAVELDPVIPKFAQKWFRLTAPVTVADALVFVADSKPKVYDYVIHDVFTGGAVATKLFSVETFESVRRSMKEDGVLAVNFVGSTDEPPNSPGTRAVSVVYQRLKHSFAHVRAFSDGIDTRTHNIVFFASQVKERVTFRKPTDSDALGSRLRIRALQSFEKHEVDQNVLNAVNGTNNSEWIFNVGLWDIAIEHRQAMMKVHPKDLWPALLAAEYPQ